MTNLGGVWRFILTFGVFLSLFVKPVFSQGEENAPHFLPLSPAELIKLVPATPDKWKVTSSMASNQVNSWLLTIAQKSMEYTPAPPQNGQPPVIMKTSIILMDTGGQQMSAGQFEKFKPGISGNRENVVINGCPTVITKEPGGRERLVMSINNRFTFNLITENQPVGTAKNWAAILDVGKLAVAGRASPPITKMPNEVQIELIDELNPKNNRRTVQAIRVN